MNEVNFRRHKPQKYTRWITKS